MEDANDTNITRFMLCVLKYIERYRASVVQMSLDMQIMKMLHMMAVVHDHLSHHRPDEAFIFWWFACKSISYEANFGDHSLPSLLLPLSSADNFEDLSLTLSTYFRKWYLPLSLKHKPYLLYGLTNKFYTTLKY